MSKFENPGQYIAWFDKADHPISYEEVQEGVRIGALEINYAKGYLETMQISKPDVFEAFGRKFMMYYKREP